MGGLADQRIITSLFLGVSLIGGAALAAPPSKQAKELYEDLHREISTVERDLLESQEKQITAAGQLKKIRRLLVLQKREIELSQNKIKELSTSLEDLSEQKRALMLNIEKQKKSLGKKLRELDRMARGEAALGGFDLTWIQGIDAENQKRYYLSKALKRNMTAVAKLKKDAQEALALELRIVEEKSKLDYYVHELKDQAALLATNEQLQREILKTNRVSRLEALRRVRALKESERELDQMLSQFKHDLNVVETESAATSLAILKGKLPLPVKGEISSTFGRSYNSKTNLFTFQKGITISTQPSSDVKAVSSGKVAFAGPLKNYGLIVIVEHPGQYYSLYGQLSHISVTDGSVIGQGQVVGTTSKEPLYFEIRNKNVAVNPLGWFASVSLTNEG